jgi:hypothetical protein
MTEAEWLVCKDPAPMFHLLERGTSERKLRLFACACCRHIWQLLSEEQRAVVESVERLADRVIPAEEMYSIAGVDPIYGVPNYAPGQIDNATRAVLEAASPDAWFGARNVRAFVVDAVRSAAGPAERAFEWQRQSDLLRCIFGNPFSTSTVIPAWLAWDGGSVVGFAQVIYDERTFERLPVLGDMLEDAGCDNEALLAHCRSRRPHALGCWALDLLLGKESRTAVAME